MILSIKNGKKIPIFIKNLKKWCFGVKNGLTDTLQYHIIKVQKFIIKEIIYEKNHIVSISCNDGV